MSNAHVQVVGLEGQKQTAVEVVDSIGKNPIAIQFKGMVLSLERFGQGFVVDSPQMPQMIDRLLTPEVKALVKHGDLYAVAIDRNTLATDRGMAIMTVEVFGEGQEQAQMIGEYELYGA